jgi:hypothetical protein
LIYFKSALAGIVAALLACAAYIGISYYEVQDSLRMLAARSPTDTFFVYVQWQLFSLESLIVTAALFLCGAYWMFRRLRLQRAS